MASMSDSLTTEAEKKLEELRPQHPEEELFVLGDPGGTFEGVFRAPTPEIWKRLKFELRGDQTRAVADQNLAVGCLLWPAREVLLAAAKKRAALFDLLSSALAEAAGAGQEAIVKK